LLLHHGDDPEIEPGELWVRILLPADRPEEYEQILMAFERDHRAAIEEFLLELVAKLREIRLVEFTFSNNPVLGPGGDTVLGCSVHDLYDGQQMRPEKLAAWRALRERYGDRDELRVDRGTLLAPAV